MKKDAPSESDSWAASSAELEVRIRINATHSLARLSSSSLRVKVVLGTIFPSHSWVMPAAMKTPDSASKRHQGLSRPSSAPGARASIAS